MSKSRFSIFLQLVSVAVAITILLIGNNILSKGKGDEMQKKKYDFLIDDSGVKGLKLGMKLKDLQSFVLKNNFKSFEDNGINASSSLPHFFIADAKNNVLFRVMIDNDSKEINDIIITSPEYKTYNGIHPGMKIKDLINVSGNMDLFKTTEMISEEFFRPNYININIVVSSNWFNPKESNFSNAVGRNYEFKDSFKLVSGEKIYADASTQDFDLEKEIIYIQVLGK